MKFVLGLAAGALLVWLAIKVVQMIYLVMYY